MITITITLSSSIITTRYCSASNNNNIILINYYNMMLQCKHLLPKDWGQRRSTLGEKISPAFLPTTFTSRIFDFFVSLIAFCLTLGGRCCRRQLLLLSVLIITLAYSCLLFICIFIILYYILYPIGLNIFLSTLFNSKYKDKYFLLLWEGRFRKQRVILSNSALYLLNKFIP